MKKRGLILAVSAVLASSMMFTSCIGSFGLTNKLLAWNRNVDNKFVNELVFIAFWIVPVYEVSALADVLVLNSIEFWSGSNPVADAGKVKTVETKDGLYAIETKADGYSIQKQGEEAVVDLNYDKETRTWSADFEGETTKLFTFAEDDDNEVVMYMPDGREMTVELSEAGVYAFQQVANSYSYYAAR